MSRRARLCSSPLSHPLLKPLRMSPQRRTCPPPSEPESIIDTSLRARSARKRGAPNGSGAAPQKHDTTTSSKGAEQPSRRTHFCVSKGRGLFQVCSAKKLWQGRKIMTIAR
ncbi:hypothetical protein KFL_002140090 [Klebsormidium nitens]|uniref:Uncharacterized protein n=1 Tax=Klebsormidium nitens TaxID=105231 RepID=A0A1Y1I205_KLENI|nr:hypothetical protein KFL_002140090 [Klebsormidium nitens]|eukprot:GAQ84955.1 hypothetical protein KFL_002140090 [Klebsormidium nitens]